MFNTLFGWYARQNLGCKFNTIVFAESIAANTIDWDITLTQAQDGDNKKEKMNGSNFIITDMYSVCLTGIVDATIYPDDDSTAKFSTQLYQPVSKKLPMPLLLMSDLRIRFDNNEGHINDVFLSFDGFWISEDNMPALTLFSELIPTALGNIDLQTLAMENILAATAAAEGVVVPGYEMPEYLQPPGEYREFCKRRQH